MRKTLRWSKPKRYSQSQFLHLVRFGTYPVSSPDPVEVRPEIVEVLNLGEEVELGTNGCLGGNTKRLARSMGIVGRYTAVKMAVVSTISAPYCSVSFALSCYFA